MSQYEENILSDEKALSRFWSKVEVDVNDPDACYQWSAKKDKNGCGIFCMYCPQLAGNKYTWKSFRAPRLMWILENDMEIPKGMLVIHSCDHEWCTNPKHLRLGTQKDNMNDRKLRGRFDTGPKGEQHPNALLTEAKVRKICHLYFNKGMNLHQIARKLNITHPTVNAIVKGRAWKHITKTHIPKKFLHKYDRCQARNQKIYKTFKDGASYDELAEQFKVGVSYVREIVRRIRKQRGESPLPLGFNSSRDRKNR